MRARVEGIGVQGESYILVHQACFAYPTVSEDDDLNPVSLEVTSDARSCSTLRRTFFLDAMVYYEDVCCRVELEAVGKAVGDKSGAELAERRRAEAV